MTNTHNILAMACQNCSNTLNYSAEDFMPEWLERKKCNECGYVIPDSLMAIRIFQMLETQAAKKLKPLKKLTLTSQEAEEFKTYVVNYFTELIDSSIKIDP